MSQRLSQRRSISSQFDKEFVRGAIREIKLSNFLIYDNVEVYPGAHLNVIVGPNATGKSTIVNAICLGLAGKTTILGRARDTAQYIKHGCNRATIEMELDGGKEPNIKIKRVLQKGTTTTSTWFINGRPAQQKQVEELVASLNIQVSNLCQFLPQDRVADFVKMSNTELLTNTMLAANRDLYEKHCQLKVAQKKTQTISTDYSKLEETLERERKLNAALERDVSHIEERDGLERKLTNLKEKRPWVEYEEYRQLHIKQKEDKDRVEKMYNDAMAVNTPYKKHVEQLKRKQADKLAEYRQIGQTMLSASRDVSSITEAVQSFSEKVEEAENILKSKENQEKTRVRRIEAVNTQIQALEVQLSTLEEQNLKPEIENCAKEMKALSYDRYEVDEEMRSLHTEKESKRLEIIALESELKKLKDVDSQKLNLVRRRDKHTYDAIIWLRAHRNDFQDVIYEPPIMTLNVKERRNAKYIENNVGFNDMKTFVCLNAADHEKFYKKVREESRLIINAAVALGRGPDDYQPPAPISQYRRFGFHSYLKDMVEAPDAVLAHLCHLSGLHRIPVGGRQVNNYIDEIPQHCPGIFRYVSDTHTYSYKKSRYGARNVLTRSVDLRPASLLIHSVDESRQEELSSKLQVLKNEEAELADGIKARLAKLGKMDKALECLKEKQKELKRRQGERKTVEEKLRLKRESLLPLEKDVIDLEQARAECMKQVEHILTDRLREVSKQADTTTAVLDGYKKRCRLGLEYFALQQTVKEKESELAERNLQLVDLERQLAEHKEQLSKTKEVARRLQIEAKKNIGHPSSFPAEKQRIFKQLPGTLEEIDAMIADIQARVDLIYVDNDRASLEYNDRISGLTEALQQLSSAPFTVSKGRQLNIYRLPRVLDEFKARALKIEKLEKSLAGSHATQTAHQNEITELKESWLPPLQEIIDRVNVQFAEYFRQLKCAGEIILKVPANPDDFDNYGIGIKVKYGDNKPMKELTTFQSGGERSVATILYMLALQELSSSPFRCVDEINQGMDAENERKVFELVVRAACRPQTPQYFLLTPKLLPDLLYTERMAVHIVHNGPYMVDHTRWNPDSFIFARSEFAE